jgi:hypothetical protein
LCTTPRIDIPSRFESNLSLRRGVPTVLEQKTTILWKCLYVLVSLKDSPGRGVRDERQRWGRQPKSWVKYHGSRGQNQRFPPIICVDEALRFPPHQGLRKYKLLFFIHLRRAPLDSRPASHLTQGREMAYRRRAAPRPRGGARSSGMAPRSDEPPGALPSV